MNEVKGIERDGEILVKTYSAERAREFVGAPPDTPVRVADHGADQNGETFTVYAVDVSWLLSD